MLVPRLIWLRSITYLRSVNPNIINNASNRMLQCSAFWNTFTRQYKKAASQRNHSRNAAIITLPMIETYTI